MKSQVKQNGSAHAVVIVCLVIALIFALGWIFWQNFIHKEPTVTNNEPVTTSQGNKSHTDNDNTEDQDNGKYLVIQEWGVKLPLTEEIADATYRMDSDNGAHLSTKRLTAKFEALTAKHETCDEGIIVRGQKGEIKWEGPDGKPQYFGDDSSEVKINDYYYTYIGGNGSCAPDDGEYEDSVKSALHIAAGKITVQ